MLSCKDGCRTLILFFVLGLLILSRAPAGVFGCEEEYQDGTQKEREGEGEGETKKKVVGSGVVQRAQQRCAGIGIAFPQIDERYVDPTKRSRMKDVPGVTDAFRQFFFFALIFIP